MPPNSSRQAGALKPAAALREQAPRSSPTGQSPESQPPTSLHAGDEVADVEVVELIASGGGVEVWRGRRADGADVTLQSLPPGASDAARDHFLAAAGDLADAMRLKPLHGVSPVLEVDPVAGAYVSAATPLGSMLDLPVLKWSADQQFEFFQQLAATVQRLHDAGLVHGSLRPENVLLDGQLRPLLINVGTVDIAAACATDPLTAGTHRPYTAPEVLAGTKADARADLFSVGRLLYFRLCGAPPDEPDEEIPRLDALRAASPGLVRIVRRCTARDPMQRYANAGSLLADLKRYTKNERAGLEHPDVDDLARFTAAAGGRPVPSGAKTSLRPRGSGGAAGHEAGAGGARRARGKREFAVLRWTRRRALAWGSLGIVALGGAATAAYLTASLLDVWRAVALLGAALLGLAFPGLGKSPGLTRLLATSVALAVVFHLDPVGLAAGGTQRTAGLRAQAVPERVAALRELLGAGEKSFVRVDLGGADLAGMVLTDVTLDGSSLRGASCVRTNFEKASLINVDVTGADFSSAKLSGTNPDFMVGWTTVKCDPSTVMPSGWSCRDGRPGPSKGGG